MAIQISGSTVIHDSQDVQVSGVVTATSFHGDASQLTNLPAAGSSLEATASGTLADGSTVIVNADGTVSVVTQTEITAPGAETPTSIASTGVDNTAAVYDSTSQKVIIAYEDTGNGSAGTVIVGTVSGTSISFGTPVVFNNAHTDYPSITYDSTNGKVVIAYKDRGNSSYGTAIVGTVSGTGISFGSATVFKSSSTGYVSPIYDSANNKVVIAYDASGGKAIVGTVSGTSISFGTEVQFNASQSIYIASAYDSTNNKVVIAYRDNGNSNYGTAIVGTVSGTSISFGSSAVFESAQTNEIVAVYDSSNQKVVIAYQDDGNSNYGTAVVGTVSGTSIGFGTPVVFESGGSVQHTSIEYDSSNQKVVIAYREYGSTSGYGTAIVGTVSGTSISFGSSIVFESASTRYISTAYDSANQKSVIVYGDLGNSAYATAAVFSTTGFGALPQLSSPTLFESGSTENIATAYDSTNNRVVIAYRDVSNSHYGTAVVGTVSGTGISFGTPTVFNSGTTVYTVAEYDPINSLVIVAYSDYGNSDYGTAIIGTVDPTDNSIAFSSEFVFNAGTTHDIGLAYDSANSKLVIAYDDASNYGYGKVKIATIDPSNNSMTFGGEVIFSGVGTNANDYIDAAYDSTNQRVVIVYRDHSNSYAATAIVGEVSGTSISFGTKNAFATTPQLQLKITYDSSSGKVVTSGDKKLYVGTVNAGNNSIAFGSVVNLPASGDGGRGDITYDSDAQKVIISYRDYSNSNYGTIISGSVSGTSIILDSPIVFETAETNDASIVYDSSNRKTVVAYRDSGNSNYGTSVVFSPRTISTNLTSENFIGISDGAYNNGQTATIQLIGSVDDAQSSLTPGQKYYVQGDGTLSETADSPSVLAGTAIASTKLLIKK